MSGLALMVTAECQCAEEEHRRDAGAHRGLGKGHVDRVHHGEQARRQERIDPGQHHHREEIANAQQAETRGGQQGQQHDIDDGYDVAPPSARSTSPAPDAWSSGEAECPSASE